MDCEWYEYHAFLKYLKIVIFLHLIESKFYMLYTMLYLNTELIIFP